MGSVELLCEWVLFQNMANCRLWGSTSKLINCDTIILLECCVILILIFFFVFIGKMVEYIYRTVWIQY